MIIAEAVTSRAVCSGTKGADFPIERHLHMSEGFFYVVSLGDNLGRHDFRDYQPQPCARLGCNQRRETEINSSLPVLEELFQVQ